MVRFGMPELEQIVRLAGKEIEREDRYIAGCFVRNPAYSIQNNKYFPGILRQDDEKFYQRLTARALLASFPLRVELEEQAEPGNNEHFDLVLYSNEARGQVAVAELKRCTHSGDIENDAKPVRDDISKLKRLAPVACSQFMMLFTLNPHDAQGTTDSWLQALIKRVPIPSDVGLTRYIFTTEGHWQKGPHSWEFGIIGLMIKESEQHNQQF